MKHIFNAGPAVLPYIVKQEAINSIKNFNETGISILEFGHRTKEVEFFFEKAETICLDMLSLNKNEYSVMFLPGGATTQFFQIPMNFLKNNETAFYIETGLFSSKAIQYAKNFGNVVVLASSKDKGFSFIPKDFSTPSNGAYIHITSNNTICGTQWQQYPETTIPLVADMTSDFMSRNIDYSKFTIIYAGAQKNVGIAGCTVVIVKNNFVKEVKRTIPSILNYGEIIKNKSMVNTPPVFAVFVTYLTMNWIKENGGVINMEKASKQKASLMYDTIDKSIFKGTANKEDRSLMNVCFKIENEILEKEFTEICTKEEIEGIKGHRSVGGFRASLYNAIELDSVKLLCDIINEFSIKKG